MNPLDAFNSLIVFCLWGLGLSVLALALLVLSQFFIDKYNMIGALKLLKEEVKKSEWAIGELSKILDRMKDCPQISLSVNPFEVADINNLKLLIVGNKRGEPRLFVYKYEDNSYYTIMGKPSFKKFGRMFSIGIKELEEIVESSSKENFKKQLDRELERKIKNHFK